MLEKLRNMTIAEMVDERDFAIAVWSIPEIQHEKPVVMWGAVDYGPGFHAKYGYDELIADFYAEHDAQKESVRNRRRADRKHPENKAERKKNKQNRMHRLYGLAYEDTKYGKTVYYWDKKEGQKKFPEYEAEILRNMKDAELEKSARAELIPDPEHYVGKSTIAKRMKRAGERMQKIADDFCRQNGYVWGERWAYDPNDHYYHVDYPDEYYRARSEYIDLCNECDERWEQKLINSGVKL